MAGRLEGATAVVTGASRGIGEATARALAAEGATVALFGRRRETLDTVAQDLGGARAYEVDVADADGVHAAIEAVARDLGRIDILVNNAGYGSLADAAAADFAEWRQMVDVNVTGVLATSHAAVGHLVDAAASSPRGVADMITISSVAGRKVAGGRFNVYAATKHAAVAFSEALRQELAPEHVRVGLIEPGLVRSELTEGTGQVADAESDSGLTMMEPTDIADAVVYMVTRPQRAAVNEILIRPIEQTR